MASGGGFSSECFFGGEGGGLRWGMLNKIWDPKTARILCTALIFALGLAFLYGARNTLTLFLFAILFAYFIDPFVSWLEQRLHNRIAAIAAVYVILIAVLVGLGFLVGPTVVSQGNSLATGLPSLLDRASSGELLSQVGQKHGWSEARQTQIQNFLISHKEVILGFARNIGQKLAQPARHIWWLILIPILSIFFLKDGQTIAANLVALARTEEDKKTLRGIIGDVNVMLGSYIRAQLILASLTLVSYTLVLSILHLHYAFVLGPLAGVFEFVPVVGPALAAITVFVIAVLTSSPHLVWVLVFLAIWRLLQDYVNAPRIMGKSLEISPVAQILAVLSGGEMAGVVGALISVPVVATLRILWRRLTNEDGPDAPVRAMPDGR
jgi:predicted PurR-regulated permease PerM